MRLLTMHSNVPLTYEVAGQFNKKAVVSEKPSQIQKRTVHLLALDGNGGWFGRYLVGVENQSKNRLNFISRRV